MQNTIVKEFEHNPEVVLAMVQVGETHGNDESVEWADTLWSNYFLRSNVIFEATQEETTKVNSLYFQPSTYLPFGRSFIIDQEGNVALPYYSHQPKMAIQTIKSLLGVTKNRSDKNKPLSHQKPAVTFIKQGKDGVQLKVQGVVSRDIQVAVFNTSGRKIKEYATSSLFSRGDHSTRNDVVFISPFSGQGKGIYFIHLHDGEHTSISKIMF